MRSRPFEFIRIRSYAILHISSVTVNFLRRTPWALLGPPKTEQRPGHHASRPLFHAIRQCFFGFPLYPYMEPRQMTSTFQNSKGHPRAIRGWPVAQLAPSGLMCPDDDLRSSRPPSCRMYTVLASVYPGEWSNVNPSRTHGCHMFSCLPGW